MNREDWARLGQHFPIGFVAWLIYFQDALAGLTVLALVVVYEAFNDWRKGDASYKDVLGLVWGFCIPVALVALWRYAVIFIGY